MAITYVGAGAVGAANSGSTFTVTGPTSQEGDLLVCLAMSTLVGGPSAVTLDGTWNTGANIMVGANRRAQLLWKIGTLAESAFAWTATKQTGTTESHAIVLAFRGANPSAPIDAVGFVTKASAAAEETVTANAIDPIGTDVHMVYAALYFQDQTDFTTPPTGTNPTFTLRADAEGATGVGATFAVASGDNDGAGVTPASWASNSVTDGFWASIVFALDASYSFSAGAAASRFYLRRR